MGKEGGTPVCAVARTIAAALLVTGAAGEETDVAEGTGSEAAEDFVKERAHGRVFGGKGVVVSAGFGSNPADTSVVVERRVYGRVAAGLDTEDGGCERFSSVAESVQVANVGRGAAVVGGAVASVVGGGERRRNFDLAKPGGAPWGGARLDEVGNGAGIILLEGGGAIFVAFEDRAGGNSGQSSVPRKQRLLMAIGVLGGIAQRVAEKIRGRRRRRVGRKRGVCARQIQTETALRGDNEGGGRLAGIVDGGGGGDVNQARRQSQVARRR